VVRPIKEFIVSRKIGGTERHGRLRVIIRCNHKKNSFVKIVYVVVVICFFFYIQVTQEIGGHVLHHKM
jgi:hypothetical protein